MPFDLLSRAEVEAVVGDHVYTLPASPMRADLAGCAVVAILVAVLSIVTHRARPGLAPRLLFAAVPVFMLVGFAAYPGPGSGRSAVHLFRALLVADAAAAGIGCAGVAAAVAFLILLRRSLPALVGGVVVLAASLVVAAGASIHAQWIRSTGGLPFFSLAGRDDLHVGHERDVPVMLARDPGR